MPVQTCPSFCFFPHAPQPQPLATLTIGTFHGSPEGHVDTDHGRAHPAGDLGTWRNWGRLQRQEPVHQEGRECGQLPPPGYLIDSSNHPRWVDTLKSNQSLRELWLGTVTEAMATATWPLRGHAGPSPSLGGWGRWEPDRRDTSSPQSAGRDGGKSRPGRSEEVRVPAGLGFMTLGGGCGTKWEGGERRKGSRRISGCIKCLLDAPCSSQSWPTFP